MVEREYLLQEVFKEYREHVHHVLKQHDNTLENLKDFIKLHEKAIQDLKLKIIIIAIISGAASSAGLKLLINLF